MEKLSNMSYKIKSRYFNNKKEVLKEISIYKSEKSRNTIRKVVIWLIITIILAVIITTIVIAYENYENTDEGG